MMIRSLGFRSKLMCSYRSFFKDMGIADCNETDVLIAIKEGIYARSKFIESAKNENPKQLIESA